MKQPLLMRRSRLWQQEIPTSRKRWTLIFRFQKYRLEDNIAKHYPQQITILKERISGMQADIQTAKANLPVDKLNGGLRFSKRGCPTVKMSQT